MPDMIGHTRMDAKSIQNVKCLLHPPRWQKAFMETMGDRLRWARKRAGYAKPMDAIRAFGFTKSTYIQHENGTRGFPSRAAQRYSTVYRVDLEWLLTGKGKPESSADTPVVGIVGAGAEVMPFDDYPRGRGFRMVEAPEGVHGAVALEIQGDSMYPLENGWLVFYRKDHAEGVLDTALNKLCVVRVKDGPTLLKKLRRGSEPGYWNLESWNGPLRENVLLEWATPVLAIKQPD